MRRFFGRDFDSQSATTNTGIAGTAYTAAAVLVLALLVSIAGSVVTYVRVTHAYTRQNSLALAQAQLDACMRNELEEETSLRGFLISGQKVFLDSYFRAHPAFVEHADELRSDLQRASLTDGVAISDDMQTAHATWERTVAEPLIAKPNAPDQRSRLQAAKILAQQIRRDQDRLTILLDDESAAAQEAVKTLLLRAALLTAALMLLFGLSAIVADIVRSRTQAALDRERVVGDTLQRAFLSGWDVVPCLQVGTAYVSAARNVAVGGDLFDVHRIDDRRCLIVVADVSGKGLDAAVDTAFVKFSLRALVEEHDDPSLLLSKFNTSFIRSTRDETSFVSLFAGVLDCVSLTLRYASAGHSPVYLRRGDDVRQLPVTGPLIGLRPEDEFPAVLELLQAHDTLVLATDGFTEARDTAGIMIDDLGAMRIIREAPKQPQKLADYIVAAVTRASGGRIADDLALLVIELLPPSEALVAPLAARTQTAAEATAPSPA
jgi:serine phosphatase RsbU (regulator of sigma subunit)